MLDFFSPGDDYQRALKAAFYYRDCLDNKLIRKFVTFHFFFPNEHIPQEGILTQVKNS